MPSTQPHTLAQKITGLAPEVDAAFREELCLLLRTLRDAGNPISVLLSMSRVSLRLIRQVFVQAGQTLPSDNPFDCIVRAARGNAEPKIQGLRILPD